MSFSSFSLGILAENVSSADSSENFNVNGTESIETVAALETGALEVVGFDAGLAAGFFLTIDEDDDTTEGFLTSFGAETVF